MTPGITELMAFVRQERLHHHANPVAATASTASRSGAAPTTRNDPPNPNAATGKRIDAVPAAAMALSAWKNRGLEAPRRSAYEDDGGLMVV